LQRKRRGHGRLGRVETGLLVRTLPIETKEHPQRKQAGFEFKQDPVDYPFVQLKSHRKRRGAKQESHKNKNSESVRQIQKTEKKNPLKASDLKTTIGS